MVTAGLSLSSASETDNAALEKCTIAVTDLLRPRFGALVLAIDANF
jgi:hypothetical protein